MKNRGLTRIFFILLGAAVITAPSYFRVFENFELATLDLRFRLRPAQRESPDIAVIEISNDTLQKIGRWPFKRSWHAAMIDILSACGARMVIFDTLFSEPSPDDDTLVEATKSAGNVYYGYSFDLASAKKGRVTEVEKIDSFIIPGLIQNAAGYGFVNVIPDRDGKTRRIPLEIKYEDKEYPHLALLTAGDYLRKDPNDIKVPADEDGFMLVNFPAAWGRSFRHYSFVDILKSYSLLTKNERGTVDLNDFRGKVCFVGLTATGTHDLNPVPLEKRYPGLGVHISSFNTIVTGRFLTRIGRFPNIAILLCLAILTAYAAARFRPVESFLFIVSAASILFTISALIFILYGIWIDLFYPLLALFAVYLSLTFYRFVSERQKRQLLERELEVAQKIQRSFLPDNPPETETLAISCRMLPAKQVGGDLYDFVELGEGQLGVMIGDVSGKGVPAALYMARAVSLFRLFSKTEGGAAGVITKLNDTLTEESKSNLFVTMSYVIYDGKERVLKFVSAGHLPVMVLKKNEEKCRLLETKEGTPLGLMPGGFSEEKIALSEGDLVILYTDGVTEAENTKKDEFGQERLAGIVEMNRSLEPEKLVSAIKDKIFKFAGSAPQHDDITIIVMTVR